MPVRSEIADAAKQGRWTPVPAPLPQVDIYYHALDVRITPHVVTIIWADDNTPQQMYFDDRDVADTYFHKDFVYSMCFALDLQMAVEWLEDKDSREDRVHG